RQLLDHIEGFSPLITNEIVGRKQFMTTQTLPDAFDTVIEETKKKPTPVFHKNHETGKEDFYFMKLDRFYDDVVEYSSLHDLLDRYYDARGERERVKQRANDLVKFVQQQLHKYQNKLSKLIDEQEGTKDKELQQLYGELITANIYQIKQGDKEITTLNYYTGEEITIPLNPTKAPAVNADRKSTRLNSSHVSNSYAVFCLKKKKQENALLQPIHASLKNKPQPSQNHLRGQ